MSLDVILQVRPIVKCEACGHEQPNTAATQEVFHANITHNLRRMASAAGLYEALWRPELLVAAQGTLLELLRLESMERWEDYKTMSKTVRPVQARDLIEPIRAGLAEIRAPSFRSPQGAVNLVGETREDLIGFAERYLAACEKHPDAIVQVDR